MTKFLLLILVTAGACNHPKSPGKEQVGIVKEFCLGATDEASFARMNEITKDKGCEGLGELVFAEKVFPLEPGDTVEVISTIADKTRIRNKDGELWVASEYLSKDTNKKTHQAYGSN